MAKQSRAVHSKALQSKTRQSKAKQCMAKQSKAWHGRAWQSMAKHWSLCCDNRTHQTNERAGEVQSLSVLESVGQKQRTVPDCYQHRLRSLELSLSRQIQQELMCYKKLPENEPGQCAFPRKADHVEFRTPRHEVPYNGETMHCESSTPLHLQVSERTEW